MNKHAVLVANGRTTPLRSQKMAATTNQAKTVRRMHVKAIDDPVDPQIVDSRLQIAEIDEDPHTATEGLGESVEEGESGKHEVEGTIDRFTHPRAIGSSARVPKDGDIVIEYHPHSKKGTRIVSVEEFKASLSDDSEPTAPPDDKPWRPFQSREDFEFAELVHDAALNRPQIERLIKLIQRCQDAPGAFTFRNYGDLKNSLDSASKLLAPVIIHLAPIPS